MYWFLFSGTGDDEKNVTSAARPLTSELSDCPGNIPYQEDASPDARCSTTKRSLTYKFTGEQNGKAVRCVAEHIAYGDTTAEAESEIIVFVECKSPQCKVVKAWVSALLQIERLDSILLKLSKYCAKYLLPVFYQWPTSKAMPNPTIFERNMSLKYSL